jgi:hypothetical protein
MTVGVEEKVELQLAASLSDLRKRIDLLENMPFTPRDTGALCTFTAQSIPNNVATPIQFNFGIGCSANLGLAIVDGSGSWADPDRILYADSDKSQTYLIYLSVEWASHATGARECGWYHSDGSVRLVRSPAVAADVTSQVFLHYRRLITPTGWNAAYVKQTSGGNLDLTNAVYAIFRYR